MQVKYKNELPPPQAHLMPNEGTNNWLYYMELIIVIYFNKVACDSIYRACCYSSKCVV